MKRIAMIVLALGLATGCYKKAATAPVPGSLNTFDSYAYRVLADAQAAINSFKTSVSSGTVKETPQVKTAMNQAIQDYNMAMAVYQAWHSAGGTGSTVGVTQSINAVQSDIASITAQGVK